jgi:Peptidase S24-like
VAIYLDGLSKGIHGNPNRQWADLVIRQQLDAEGWTVIVVASSDLTDLEAMVLHFRRLAHALKQRARAQHLAQDGSWFAVATAGARKVIDIVSRELAKPFETHLPLYPLRAAAGKFGNGEEVTEEGWVEAGGIGRLDPGMFVVRAVGRSMESLIHDGDYLVFRAHPVGSREGKVVLVQYRGPADPETGGAYTVKHYHSEKATPVWRHSPVSEFPPIALEPSAEDDVRRRPPNCRPVRPLAGASLPRTPSRAFHGSKLVAGFSLLRAGGWSALLAGSPRARGQESPRRRAFRKRRGNPGAARPGDMAENGHCVDYPGQRRDRKQSRSSFVKSTGCSNAAKWPPRSSSFQ